MKEIKAYIKSIKENSVLEELRKIEGLTGVTILPVSSGFGRNRIEGGPVHIMNDSGDSVPHIKLELVCHDKLAVDVVNAIQKSAHTGLREDGKIYISSVEGAVRISTNEEGEDAC